MSHDKPTANKCKLHALQVVNRLELYVYAVQHGLGVEQEKMKAVG